MKVINNRSFLFLTIILGVMAGSLFGCAAREQNVRAWNEYRNLPKQQSSDFHDNRIRSVADDAIDAEAFHEMTGDELERSGDFLLNRGNFDKAFVQYEKALQLKPDNIRVQYKKGLLFLLGRMNEDAIKEFQGVLEREPGYALAYKGLGQAFFQVKKYDQAEENFQKAVELDPKFWKAYNSLGIIHDYQTRYDMAIQEYSAAISLRPDNGLLYNNLGVSYAMAGKNEKAINAFSKALEAEYSGSKVYNNLGLVLAKSGRYDEALEAFRKGGDEANAHNNLGCIYLKQGEFDKAISCFEKAIEINPTFYIKAGENLRKAKAAQNQLPLDDPLTAIFKDLS
ncbi:MAG: tetratricopeptide repeat protein [Deltaproteobacteria bacterium]|nr:tetratricopeptide repeat protein [Deltaproteobacteria bacterium]